MMFRSYQCYLCVILCLCLQCCRDEIHVTPVLCPAECANTCDAEGLCPVIPTCPEFCRNGCDTKSYCICDAACPQNCASDGSCTNDPCDTATCNAESEYCHQGKCLPIDANHNHMIDIYEIAANQGKSCLRDAECDAPGEAGFCDSFIGYRCSTRCTSDTQCVTHSETADEPYTFVCRADGRCAPDAFITTWSIPDASLDPNRTQTLTIHAQNCDFDIDWGDGTHEHVSECTDTSPAHHYEPGTYTVVIKGKLEDFHAPRPVTSWMFGSPLLTEVRAFGPVGLGHACFANTTLEKLSDTDIPDATLLHTLAQAFSHCTWFNLPLEHWDTSHVTDMRGAFENAQTFNQPLARWHTGNVKNMASMFDLANTFNQPLTHWETDNVQHMNHMFANAEAFNQPIGHWNTQNVTDMSYMFATAASFNQPIGNWNTQNVTDMSYMFSNAASFNQPIGHWNTQNITDMSYMFSNAASFNQPIGHWNTQNVITLEAMFADAPVFNQPLSNWHTSSLKIVTETFRGARAFDQDISTWDISQIIYYDDMFLDSGLSQPNYCKLMSIPPWRPLAQTLNLPSAVCD